MTIYNLLSAANVLISLVSAGFMFRETAKHKNRYRFIFVVIALACLY